jgi:hypothetical protein
MWNCLGAGAMFRSLWQRPEMLLSYLHDAGQPLRIAITKYQGQLAPQNGLSTMKNNNSQQNRSS